MEPSPAHTVATRAERVIWFYLGFWLALPLVLQRWRFDKPVLRILLGLGFAGILFWAIVSRIEDHPLEIIGFLLLLQALQTAWCSRDRWILFSLGSCALLLLISVTETRAWPHYLAPAAPILFFLLIQAIRALRARRAFGFPWGRMIASALPLIMLGLLAADILHYPSSRPPSWTRPSYAITPFWATTRASIIEGHSAGSDRHLFFVRYPDWYSPHDEWVHNKADIDGQVIVWAHDLGPTRNAKLLDYYPERRAWLVEPGKQPIAISPYSRKRLSHQ